MLAFHGISTQNRERIIDWMLQVLHALNVDSPCTFFTAVSYLDRYLVAKFNKSQPVGSEHLYLVGITATLLASKLEDVKVITVSTMLDKAGHGKFT